MGQYYRIVNLDRSEYLDPGCFEQGPKFHNLWSRGGIMEALGVLLASDRFEGDDVTGRWAGQRVVVLGDEARAEPWRGLWDQTHEEPFEDISAKARARVRSA
jgi:hypothetical protein